MSQKKDFFLHLETSYFRLFRIFANVRVAKETLLIKNKWVNRYDFN